VCSDGSGLVLGAWRGDHDSGWMGDGGVVVGSVGNGGYVRDASLVGRDDGGRGFVSDVVGWRDVGDVSMAAVVGLEGIVFFKGRLVWGRGRG